ncbi:DsrE/DsrF/DrsH-like family protein [Candidatus Formimonas warabiya]|uniref:Pyridine nucleotide-disulfide oxidoreductase n=1 Tax=Formimonas warabiya TaxID=1761012 RepID=A0A3G1KYF7_FORW1|nr:DsrE/DsrF/DrsH-like family protein [Candidatus Formimonas warabiya]ATW27508.1 pyridine nucleotide-disulfide oxidoreductase [Candidatus Formimonas warabiya]
MQKKIIIVGGVAGGAGAAARLRRLDEQAEIILFEKGEYISFANCGLPYYLGGVISEREKLLVQTVDKMEERFHLDIRTRSEVTAIFPDVKEVEVVSGEQIYRENYDYLVLSPGAAPVVPPVQGVGTEGIFTLRNMADVDLVKNYLSNSKPRRGVVIGGGYVGVEMAENLKQAGLDVVLIEAADQVIGPLDQEMARILEKALLDNGIKLVLKDMVEKFEREDRISVFLKSGRKLETDLVVLAVGVKPDVKLAQEAGLAIGEKGGIKVDEHLRTSDPYIYAVGDAIEVKDLVSGQFSLIPLAGPANKQARIVADNICGRTTKYQGSQGTSILKVFHLTGAATGNNEKMLRAAGTPYLKSYTHSGSHAGYYPGALTMTVKILFAPETGKILGAQIVGSKGIDKRIDVLAAAIKQGMTVYDLEELELAYAPPFSSAKDPVNMAGFVAANILKGDVKVVHWDEMGKLNPDAYFILDVRTKMEYENGYYPGAVNIPLDNLRQRLNEIPKDKKLLVYCKIGLRGYLACRILTQNSFEAFNISGGYDLYLAGTDQSGKSLNLDEQMTKIEDPEKPKKPETETGKKVIKIDACGLQCPGPIMRVHQELENISEGDILEIHATDPGFAIDIKAWCRRTGNTLLEVKATDMDHVALIRKGSDNEGNGAQVPTGELPQGKSLLVFSGDLDKAMASFIIANGAAAMGRKVTMFFTFWGLNILRKDRAVPVNKTLMEQMFALMMPRGSRKLTLSKMNMGGMGGKMIRGIMKRKNIASLEELIDQAKAQGVKLVACTMSMDVMGIRKEELIDGIEFGGVAAYLADAEESNVNLFI